MAVRIKPPEQGGVNIDERMVIVRHIMAKVKADEAKTEQADVRPKLVSILTQIEPDADGHRTLRLDEPVMGYGAVQYQRRVSIVPNNERILAILEEHGLTDSCTEVTRVPNEEAIMNAVYSEQLPEVLLNEMYPQKETFAVVVKRA
jgi:predicted YcjX-like family ATPase